MPKQTAVGQQRQLFASENELLILMRAFKRHFPNRQRPSDPSARTSVESVRLSISPAHHEKHFVDLYLFSQRFVHIKANIYALIFFFIFIFILSHFYHVALSCFVIDSLTD